MIDVIEFASREEASIAAAKRISGLLQARLRADADANIVVSGGSTPTQCFEALSQKELDWSRVRVALSDERWVPPDHEASNEEMIRHYLLQNSASPASMVSIYQPDTTVEERCETLQDQLGELRFACSLIGMGADGHFASLFPDAEQLALGLSLTTPDIYIPIQTAASPYDRVSLTLAALLRSDEVIVLFFGEEKVTTLNEAIADRDAYPIGHLIHQRTSPVRGYWAP